MKDFRYIRPRSSAEAAQLMEAGKAARLHAGGVDLLDRMKERLDEPDLLVGLLDASGMDFAGIDEDGDIRIGARVTLAQLAASDVIRRFLPTLAQAAGDAASPQLRNRATLGGNLAQHTRCGYYRLESFPCLKRGGASCPVRADGGVQEHAGIFGNDPCASAHPSSIAPVLGSLGAEVQVVGPQAERRIPFAEFWAAPRKGVAGDTVLAADEVIDSVVIPPRDERQFVGHAEVRHRAAFDWAVASCAVRYVLDGEKIKEASVWFGSLAPTPWRAEKAEQALIGRACTDAAADKAAAAVLVDAKPLPGTAYKVQLARVVLKRALAAARERAR